MGGLPLMVLLSAECNGYNNPGTITTPQVKTSLLISRLKEQSLFIATAVQFWGFRKKHYKNSHSDTNSVLYNLCTIPEQCLGVRGGPVN